MVFWKDLNGSVEPKQKSQRLSGVTLPLFLACYMASGYSFILIKMP